MSASGNEDEGYQTHLLEEEESKGSVQSKGKQRPKGKKKKKKKNRPQEWARLAEEAERKRTEEEERKQIKKEAQREHPDVEVEYIQDTLEMDMSDPMYRTFSVSYTHLRAHETLR